MANPRVETKAWWNISKSNQNYIYNYKHDFNYIYDFEECLFIISIILVFFFSILIVKFYSILYIVLMVIMFNGLIILNAIVPWI